MWPMEQPELKHAVSDMNTGIKSQQILQVEFLRCG